MKKFIILLFLMAFSIIHVKAMPPGYIRQTENEYLALYFNPNTAAVAVRVLESGNIWHSNPPDWLQDERVGGINREFIQSQIRISYFNASAQEFSMNSFADSVMPGQFELISLPDGFKVIYTLGDRGDRLVIPGIISAERLELFRPYMTDRDWATVMRRFIEEGDLFILREGQGDFAYGQLHDILYAAGYTRYDLEYDNAANNVEVAEAGLYFVIPLVYRLDGGSLIAYIPTDGIEAPADFPLARITMLEFFGAAGFDVEGYMFVPDGSGALIHLNNGRTTGQQFIARVYGRDRTFFTPMLPPQPEPVRMPVFGIRHDDKAMFAIIEDGDGFATIFARVSGIINSYNWINVEFLARPFDFLQLEHMGDNMLQIFQPSIFDGSFRIRYTFLEGSEANYSGMARFYQSYLVERGLLTRRDVHDELPFVFESLGAIQRTQNFMGIPFQGTVALTTFDQTIYILENLRNNDINNIMLKYSGWINGGMNQRAPTNLNITRQLGNTRGFENLVRYVNENNIPFFPEVHFNYAHRPRFNLLSRLTRGFVPAVHAARNLNNSVSRRTNFHIASNIDTSIAMFGAGRGAPTPFIVSPAFFARFVDSFIGNFNRFGSTGISTGSLFSEVNSAFNNNGSVDRQQAINYVVETGNRLAEAGHRQLSNGANAFGFANLDMIINVPFECNGFMVSNISIPFYQMVIRGFIEYTGTPVNTSSDLQRHLLHTLETGSGIYAQFMYAPNSTIRETHFTHFFSHNFHRNSVRVIDIYNRAAAVLNQVQGQRILQHDILSNGLRRVIYENGVVILINYTDYVLQYENISVSALGYAVTRVNP